MRVYLTNRVNESKSRDEERPLIELKPPFIPKQLVQYVYDDYLTDWVVPDTDDRGAVTIICLQCESKKVAPLP